MKTNIFLFTICVLIWNCNSQKNIVSQESYSEIQAFQKELNEQYASEAESPLLAEDRAAFSSLDFYTIDLKFRVNAAVELTPNEEYFEMQTSTKRLPLYRKFAKLTFKINKKTFSLFVYQNKELKDYLFVPFTDLTSGETSYGGGRYIEVNIPEQAKTIVLDFNQAYNPYCAYNPRYSCPIPPKENFVDYEIKAGVKKFHD